MCVFEQPKTSKRKGPFSHDRIIPPEEDIRRLLQECRIGQGNASLLSESLTFAKPEELAKKEIIRVSSLCKFKTKTKYWLGRNFISNVFRPRNLSSHKFRGHRLVLSALG
jgi:hypothetical protein